MWYVGHLFFETQTPDISFNLKPCDLKFGIHVVKTLLLLWNQHFIHITNTIWFFRHFIRIGSVLSRSELDPYLYIWYHTNQIQNGLCPCAMYFTTSKFHEIPLSGFRGVSLTKKKTDRMFDWQTGQKHYTNCNLLHGV